VGPSGSDAGTRESSLHVSFPPPIALAKAFSPSGCGWIFSCFQRGLRNRLSTASSGKQPKSFSPARHSLNLMTAPIWCRVCSQLKDICFSDWQPEHFDAGGIRRDGTEIECLPVPVRQVKPVSRSRGIDRCRHCGHSLRLVSRITMRTKGEFPALAHMAAFVRFADLHLGVHSSGTLPLATTLIQPDSLSILPMGLLIVTKSRRTANSVGDNTQFGAHENIGPTDQALLSIVGNRALSHGLRLCSAR
jgi:hypothetical protein